MIKDEDGTLGGLSLHRCYTEKNVDRRITGFLILLWGRMNFKLWFQNPMVGRFIEEDIKYRVMTV